MSKQDQLLSERRDILKKTRLFGALSDAVLLEVAVQAGEMQLEAGELLFSAGDPSRGLFVVVSGRTRAFRHSHDGREQIIHEDRAGATFPEVAVFDDGPYPSSVEAVTKTRLLFVPKETVRTLCRAHPELSLTALAILAGRLRKATGMVENLALRSVSQRLAEYLLREAEAGKQRPRPNKFEIVHTNQEIADILGTVREVVSRGFKKLQTEGWIRKKSRAIEILDPAGLKAFAEGTE